MPARIENDNGDSNDEQNQDPDSILQVKQFTNGKYQEPIFLMELITLPRQQTE